MTSRSKTRWLTLFAALIIGVVNPPVLKGFEFIVIQGTEWLWNDLFNTDVHRWRAIVLAVVGSVLLSAAFRLLGQTRIVHQTSDIAEYGSEAAGVPRLRDIGTVLLIGAASLLFGASLGPEASLMAFAGGIGLLVAARFNLSTSGLLKAASIGALLVAFTGSIVPVLFPLLLLLKKAKPTLMRLPWRSSGQLGALVGKNWRAIARGFVDVVLPVLLASGAAFFVMWLMDHSVAGYGKVAIDQPIKPYDFVLALIAGIVALGIGTLLKLCIKHFGKFAQWSDSRLPWPVSAGIFGLVIGLLYLIGGQSVQFSGSVGSSLLLGEAATVGVGALLGLLIVKLLVTAWSLATGYRGGLVFPTIYMGIAIALLLYRLSGASDPGVLIGAIAGVFGAMTGPVAALIFIMSVLPPRAEIWVVAAFGILGAYLAQLVLRRLVSHTSNT